jgi:hypothetical protein
MIFPDLLKNCERYIAILANIVVILGVPAFFYQQHLSNKSDTEKVTLAYVERFQNNDLIKAQLDLFDEWRRYPVALVHADIESLKDFAEKDMSARDARGDHSIDDALFRFDAFYAELAQCVEKKICSKDLSQTYFQDFAVRLICLYGQHYAEVERTLGVSGFGAGIRKIAGDASKCG